MKKHYSLFIILFSILLSVCQSSVAGTGTIPDPAKQAADMMRNSGPANPPSILSAGNDIVIKSAAENQTDVKVATAFNGWIYSVFTSHGGAADSICVSLSKDHGLTFNPLIVEAGTYYSSDILICGTDTNDLDLFIASNMYDAGTGMNTFWVNQYDGLTGGINAQPLSESSTDTIYDVALAHDFSHPSGSASTYSVEAIYSKHEATTDTIVAYLSLDGGNTFSDRKIVDTISTDRFGKLAVCYGYSPDDNAGKYFVAYEQHVAGQKYGHLKVCRTDAGVTDVFTAPIYVDSLWTTVSQWANQASDPSIAAQNSTTSNSSNGLSVVVFWQSRYVGGTDIDNVCASSLMAGTTGATWTAGYVDYGVIHTYQADVCYDEDHDQFLVTYWDSTNNNLRYFTQSFNMPNPTTWTLVISSYSDHVGSLSDAYPQISYDPYYGTANFVWNEIRGGNRTALFDAEFSLTGIHGPNGMQSGAFKSYPNPASDIANFSFSLDKTQAVTIEMFDVVGKKISIIENEMMSAGSHMVKIDAAKLPAGYYTVRYKTELELNINKLLIAR